MENLVLQLVLMGSGLLMLLCQWIAARRMSPGFGIAFRWMRWIFTALIVTNVFALFNYTGHPQWAVAAAAFLGWFLIESIYTWLAITALSRSELPLFPRFQENQKGSEWPATEDFIRLRGWLRREGFQNIGNYLARHEDQILIRLAVMEREDHKVRATILFFPNLRGEATAAYAFHSVASDGTRLLTDNLFLPFGGFYPDSWKVERRPRLRSMERLYLRHLARCDAHGRELQALGQDPLDEINQHNQEMERINRELGFLTKRDEEEADGRITTPGRVRVWSEIWTLNYLGQARRY